MEVALVGSVWVERCGPRGTLGFKRAAQLLVIGYAKLSLLLLVRFGVLVGMLTSLAKLYERSRISGGMATLRTTKAAAARGSGARFTGEIMPP